MSDLLEGKAVELLDKLEKLATSYAPDVMDTAVRVMQVEATANIALGLMCVILFFVNGYYGYKLTKKFGKVVDDYNTSGTDVTREQKMQAEFFQVATIVAGIVIAAFTGIAMFVNLLDVWSWVALFNPELALAHKVLGL